MIYTTFAQLYDELMDQTIYDNWLDFLGGRFSPDQGLLLDLGCGSGALTVLIKKRGYQVEGLDLSEEMLSLAAQRTAEAKLDVPFYQGDMTDLSSLGEYAGVISSLDSLCYLPDPAAVQLAFSQVAAHLQKGGRFLFDVHSTYQMDTIFPDYMYNFQTDEQAFLWHSYPTDVDHAIEHELTFFILDHSTGQFERLNEYHYERTYPLQKYLKWLKEAGFTQITVTADFGRQAVKSDSIRWFFDCRLGEKPGGKLE
ncbi:SAM-dependent methyltransferase [Ligilactobacillus salitolerans]|uniref:SAM-dependent methyltransferase n=1 Tax=Ligilactobacillus salitolerans TaxID=1808352 RepID=A0A401IVU8_9LACO|nr:class I SAM-dependent methyltransferase [Ligilactobacillus salitolerans]GBG95626.1 SAM-dependent methyltransferase [Ligilactobacillus salitolerans]